MQPMSSMQTALLPGVTPGWNDPPPLGNPASGSRLNRYRRVVDPSLSAAGGSPAPYAASPQQGLPPMGTSQGYPSPHQPLHQVQHPQQQPQQVAYPQQPQQLQYAQPVPMQPMVQPQQVYMQQPVQPQQQYAQPDYSMPFEDNSVSRQEQQHSLNQLYGGPGGDSSFIRGADCMQVGPKNDAWGPIDDMAPFFPNPNVTNPADNRPIAGSNPPLANPGTSHDPNYLAMIAAIKNKQPELHSRPLNHSLPSNPDEASWSMPGVVPDFSKGSYYDPENFKVPTITPGNLSMSPTLIFKYMIGATHRLVHAGLLEKAKGVQLMIKDVEIELVQAGAAFVIDFNHVANYINVENYVEAEKKLNEVIGKFAEQSLDDNRLEKKWIRGIRFLIHESKSKKISTRGL